MNDRDASHTNIVYDVVKQRDQLDTLSGGEKRKIILNDALGKDSLILLLDELESFLDMESQERL